MGRWLVVGIRIVEGKKGKGKGKKGERKGKEGVYVCSGLFIIEAVLGTRDIKTALSQETSERYVSGKQDVVFRTVSRNRGYIYIIGSLELLVGLI